VTQTKSSSSLTCPSSKMQIHKRPAISRELSALEKLDRRTGIWWISSSHATACENASQHVLHACFRKAVLQRPAVYEPKSLEDVGRRLASARNKRDRYS